MEYVNEHMGCLEDTICWGMCLTDKSVFNSACIASKFELSRVEAPNVTLSYYVSCKTENYTRCIHTPLVDLDDAAQLNYFLPEEEILEDLRIINKVSSKPVNRKAVTQNLPLTNCSENVYEARIDDGRLYFDKRWSVVINNNFYLCSAIKSNRSSSVALYKD